MDVFDATDHVGRHRRAGRTFSRVVQPGFPSGRAGPCWTGARQLGSCRRDLDRVWALRSPSPKLSVGRFPSSEEMSTSQRIRADPFSDS
jgi:hypothetical protein